MSLNINKNKRHFMILINMKVYGIIMYLTITLDSDPLSGLFCWSCLTESNTHGHTNESATSLCHHQANFYSDGWQDTASKIAFFHHTGQRSIAQRPGATHKNLRGDLSPSPYGQISVYDRSRIFDIRPKPKFSFKKIRLLAEGISRSQRYKFL